MKILTQTRKYRRHVFRKIAGEQINSSKQALFPASNSVIFANILPTEINYMTEPGVVEGHSNTPTGRALCFSPCNISLVMLLVSVSAVFFLNRCMSYLL